MSRRNQLRRDDARAAMVLTPGDTSAKAPVVFDLRTSLGGFSLRESSGVRRGPFLAPRRDRVSVCLFSCTRPAAPRNVITGTIPARKRASQTVDQNSEYEEDGDHAAVFRICLARGPCGGLSCAHSGREGRCTRLSDPSAAHLRWLSIRWLYRHSAAPLR